MKWKNEQENKLLKTYITDTLKIIAENTARFGGGSTISKRYIDLIKTQKPGKEESEEEIINRIKNKLQGGDVG